MTPIPIGFGWGAFGIIVVLIALFCFFVIRYYTDRHEAEVLPTVVTVAALTLSLLALFLIPIDILSVSTQADMGIEVRAIYFILYGSILAFAFVIIPFTYFYYEEFDEDVTFKQRFWAGFKYTLFLLVIVVVLLIIGIFVYKSHTPPEGNTDISEWAKYITDSANGGEGSIVFAVACLGIIGFAVWITYTAYGLSSFPIGLLKGKRHLAEEASDIQSDLDHTREQARAISSKYMTGKKMSAKDEKQLDLLKRQEKMLARRNQQIAVSARGCAKIANACKPFVFIFGIILFLVSVLIFVSILLTLIDKVTNSCGVKCGFFAQYPEISNPVDLLLWHLAPYFPMDYVVLGSLIGYIFFCTLNGVVKIGVRFLWVHLYDIKPRRTPPQGLLLTAIILMLALLVLNMEILTVAPRYASYGTQTYLPENSTELAPCSNTAPPANCTMTQIGTFVAIIQFGTPFFGNVYYYAMWVFIVAFLIGSIVNCVRRKSSNLDEQNSDDDEEFGRV